MGEQDIRWQQRFSNYFRALEPLLGSRDTLKKVFRLGLIQDGEAWMLMIQDRNLTSHTYNRSTGLRASLETMLPKSPP